jgi:tRNA-binding EMAP/Myf-like protein
MKWLNDYVKADMSIKDYCHALTMSGSKVEGYEIEGSNISNVVVGKILEKGQHENADALFVCKVDAGLDAPIQIVTNAKNVKEGDLVPVALDGAVLPEGKIKKGKLRAVASVDELDARGIDLEGFYLDIINADENAPLVNIGGDDILNIDGEEAETPKGDETV